MGVWVLQHTSDPRFPSRLRIFTGGRTEPMLSFFVQDRWPGSHQHIVCPRESRMAEDARAIADLHAPLPRLRLVFCSNRETAAEWTRSHFAAVWPTRGNLGEAMDELPARRRGRSHNSGG